jgi:hypothetical protein
MALAFTPFTVNVAVNDVSYKLLNIKAFTGKRHGERLPKSFTVYPFRYS